MVRFKDDCETFCLYIVHRPPNIDGVVDQHVEDRHLEKAVRGIYYVAHYDHRPAEGEAVRVHLDQFCGRLDPDDETGVEARATAWKSNDIDQRVRAAVAEAGGMIRSGAIRYSGELVSPAR